ncbi:T9SS type A sorting domain-containing protein [Brumimicrobium aurantiacum]|uniref:T9SS C-terminal target domain-containing protein n=1 Tax=Brumimicrobium aurantiacum TaxID=1737063 RepID=A0A3E1F1J6_9FLAO|nr:T9SS type A sorting domain-containing protein [Brumimicrobium aurantiacum]RFC55701.1 T9SS C-terminal target domain-containing protein [Brumimicrobium aurantiacum]
MKKIYVMAAFLGASSFAFNQVVQEAPSHFTKSTKKAISNNNGVTKAPGVSLWSDDFSDETTWTIGNSGQQGTFDIGVEADLPNPNYYSVITSPTATNGFAFFEGVQFLLAGSVDVQNSWVESNTSVDCSAHSQITVNFHQEYRAFNDDVTYVEISLDGGLTWEQTVDVNAGIVVNTYATETEKFVNFNVNNSSDVRVRFRWENTSTDNQYGSGYAWMVDDVQISSLADHDIATSGLNYGTAGLFYTQIPVTQIAPIGSAVVLNNQGSSDQTNVVLNAEEVIAGNYSSTSTPVAIVAGGDDSVAVNSDFTPSGAGNYQIDYSITYDNTDDVPSNNMLESYTFTVGTNIYARDTSTQAEMGTVYGRMTGSNATPSPRELQPGTLYDIYTDQSLTGIDFQFGDVISEGSEVYGEIFDSNLDPIANGETMPYTVVSGDEGTYHTLVFDTPVDLVAGETYLVSVKCFDTDFSVATAGASAAQTSFVYYPDETTWYYTLSTPVIRMNFDPTLNVENNELSNLNVTQNFPNPFSTETTVQFNLKEAADVSYSVVDMTGKVMLNVNEGNTIAGDHQITIDGSSFANGVYYLNITAGESNVTRKMIVNK